MTSLKWTSQKPSGRTHLEIQLNVTCKGQAPRRGDQSCIPELFVVKALITVNSFAPHANTPHCSTGILFQAIINVENRSCWLWAGIINSIRSVASIMGLLMVPNRSWTFLRSEGRAERQAALLGRQPHLWPAGGWKGHRCQSQSIARALRWPSLGAWAAAMGWGGTCGDATTLQLVAGCRQGCRWTSGAVDIPEPWAHPTPHWVTIDGEDGNHRDNGTAGHGSMWRGSVTFRSPGHCCDWGADTAVPGLSSGARIELADASIDARGSQELRELGSRDGRGMLALNINSVKY